MGVAGRTLPGPICAERDSPAEAINLGRVLVELMPSETEALGLLALMLHCEARREARRDAEGAYMPLSEQDVTRWSREMIAEAEHFLSEASRMQRMDSVHTAVLRLDCQTGIVSISAKDDKEGFLARVASVLDYARAGGIAVIHVRVGFRRGAFNYSPHPNITHCSRNRWERYPLQSPQKKRRL